VVFAGDLAELERIQGEADVAVRREPRRVILVADFAAVRDAVLHDIAMPADVKNRRMRAGGDRPIQVSGDE
jgi:hypothetical protein